MNSIYHFYHSKDTKQDLKSQQLKLNFKCMGRTFPEKINDKLYHDVERVLI